MFRYESEMIPVLHENIAKIFNTEYITTEFGSGNGVADLVFTTKMSNEKLFLNDYGMMALFVNLFCSKYKLSKENLLKNSTNIKSLKKLLIYLETEEYISINEDVIIRTKKYQAHTKNLFSVEAKLKDWKSGVYQAMRYKFYSHKSFLAYPSQYIHRVDMKLLKEFNVGLISVEADIIKIEFNPEVEYPKDLTSYYFLSELFAQEFKRNSRFGIANEI